MRPYILRLNLHKLQFRVVHYLHFIHWVLQMKDVLLKLFYGQFYIVRWINFICKPGTRNDGSAWQEIKTENIRTLLILVYFCCWTVKTFGSDFKS